MGTASHHINVIPLLFLHSLPYVALLALLTRKECKKGKGNKDMYQSKKRMVL